MKKLNRGKSYEQSVKKAYKEVHDTLAKENLAKSRLAFQEEELKAYQKVLDLSTKRFNQGVANQLEVLDAQKSVLSASSSLFNSLESRPSSPISLLDE